MTVTIKILNRPRSNSRRIFKKRKKDLKNWNLIKTFKPETDGWIVIRETINKMKARGSVVLATVVH